MKIGNVEFNKIIIEVVPEVRNNGAGDWFIRDGDLIIQSYESGDSVQNFLIQYHELTEAILCFHREIDEKAVDKFDADCEVKVAKGELSEDADPGQLPDAPYRNEHIFAMQQEYALGLQFGREAYYLDKEWFQRVIMGKKT